MFKQGWETYMSKGTFSKSVLAFLCATLPVLSHGETSRDAAQRNYGIVGVSSLGAGMTATALGYARVFKEGTNYETKFDQTIKIPINLDRQSQTVQEPPYENIASLFDQVKKQGRGCAVVEIRNTHDQPTLLKTKGLVYTSRKAGLRGFSASLEKRNPVDLAKSTANLIKSMWDFSEKPCRPQNIPSSHLRVRLVTERIIPNRWNSLLFGLGASTMILGVICVTVAAKLSFPAKAK